ncbi:MAG: hypothetical protein AAF713_19490 [Pseudomonadota bacterium]
MTDRAWRAEVAVVHIGAPRTGTTAIQEMLATNRNTLLRHGVLYPESLGSVASQNLVAALAPLRVQDAIRRKRGLVGARSIGAYRRDLEAALWREMAAHRPQTLLISAEQFFDRVDTFWTRRRLAMFLRSFAREARVVVYLRRQDQAIWSRHLHGIKLGKPGDFVAPSRAEPLYDYAARLLPWQKLFGAERLTVRAYQPSSLEGGGAAKDFLAQIGLSGCAIAPVGKRNTSLDIVRAAFMQRIGAALGAQGAESLAEDLAGAIDRLEARGPPARLPRRESEAILSLYRASNARLSAQFGGGEPFFNDAIEEVPLAGGPVLDLDAAVIIAADLWAVKQRQVQSLKRRLGKGG